jgi:hypothetical protein
MINLSELLDSFRQGNTNAKSHMKNLIEMAAADKVFATEEEALLKALAKKKWYIHTSFERDSIKSGHIYF